MVHINGAGTGGGEENLKKILTLLGETVVPEGNRRLEKSREALRLSSFAVEES